MSALTQGLLGELSKILNRYIAPLFLEQMNLTIIARDPSNPEGDVLVTNDDLDGLAALIERSKPREIIR